MYWPWDQTKGGNEKKYQGFLNGGRDYEISEKHRGSKLNKTDKQTNKQNKFKTNVNVKTSVEKEKSRKRKFSNSFLYVEIMG